MDALLAVPGDVGSAEWTATLPRVARISHLRELGYSPSAVRHAVTTARWTRLVSGILLTRAGPPTRADWLRAGLLLAGPAAVISGWDAVRAHGLGDSRPPVPRVLVLAPRGRHRVTGAIRIRPTRRTYAPSEISTSLEVPEGGTLPFVCIARAIADTALEYRFADPVRALVTSSVQRGMCTPEDLAAELGSSPRNGSALLRRAVEEARDGARSIAEAEALSYLRRANVPRFELNVPIVRPDGVVLAVADVLWRELRAIAEIDSREFHFREMDWKRTMRRHNLLTAAGFAVAHFPPSEIRGDQELWADRVAGWLQRRASELGLEYRPDPQPLRAGPLGPPPVVTS